MITRLDPRHLYLLTAPETVGLVRGSVVVEMSALTASLLRPDLKEFARARSATRDAVRHANITVACKQNGIRIRDHKTDAELTLTRAELAAVLANLRDAIACARARARAVGRHADVRAIHESPLLPAERITP